MVLSENEGVSQTHLVNKSGIDRSTLADIVRRLLRKGLLERRRTKHDARAYAVRISEVGRNLLAAAAPLATEVDQKILSHLPESDRTKVLDALAIVATIAEHEES